MLSRTLSGKLAHSFPPVKPPDLGPAAIEAMAAKYSRTEARHALDDLDQGVLDILETCRVALGWPTITSLAAKYYPLYPHRKCWKRALAKCKLQQIRTVTLNIRYLLLAVICQVRQSIKASTAGESVTNRLLSIRTYYQDKRDSYRLGGERGERPANRTDCSDQAMFGTYADAILSR